ncbi:MAG: winged helix-turn-helix transcriptional regulator [Promethearchaeota archaeon]
MPENTKHSCQTGNEMHDICFCPLQGVIDIISRKWALLIVATIGNHQKLRYNELRERLGEISPKTLADRLKELEGEGLINREAFAEIPPRVEYSLTDRGEELRKAMMPLMKWASQEPMKKAT